MSDPVDLINLRSMTDGDVEMEKALFEEFCSSFEEGIAQLKTHLDAAASEAWRGKAHALKGIAYNLGAAQLGELCKQAQEGFEASSTIKAALLADIQAEYDRVKDFLLTA